MPSASRRVLIISHDVVGSRMAGPGIRYWEMARFLAEQQPVTLVAPRVIDAPASVFAVATYAWGDAASLAPYIEDADVAVANGFVLQAHPELAGMRLPLAVDLYDPIALENLELYRAAPALERAEQHRADVTLLQRQLAAGDFFLCATERQRDLYLGALMLAGRLTPARTDADPQMRNLVDVVPFGLPSAAPVKQHAALRGVLPGIADDDTVLLWSSGLWDWLDPLTLIEAMPAVVARQPGIRLVFLAGPHPGAVPAMRMPGAARAAAEAGGLLNRHVFFYNQWIPYARRADFLLEADIAISLHGNHLETSYAAVRSRFLDHLWAGLPSVVSDGDAAAELVRRHELGQVVPPGDAAALAAALVTLIEDRDERDRCAARARELASSMTWEQCLKPLEAWCGSARKYEDSVPGGGMDSDHTAVPPPAPPSSVNAEPHDMDIDAGRNAALSLLDKYWQLAEPTAGGLLAPLRRFLIRQFVRPFVVPLLQQQMTYNGVVAKALYALAESSDRRHEVADQSVAALDGQIVHLQQRVDELELGLRPVQRRVDELELGLRPVQQRVDELELGLRPVQQRVDELEGTSRDALRRIHALDEHALDLDDTDTTLAELLLIDRANINPRPDEAV